MLEKKVIWKRKKLGRFLIQTEGGAAVEAAVAMPFFLLFILALQAFLQISIAGTALQLSLTNTTNMIASHVYPVELLYGEAQSRLSQTKPIEILQNVLDRIGQARDTAVGAENAMEQYASYVPDAILEWARFEKRKREQLEQAGQDQLAETTDKYLAPLINKAFTEVVKQNATAKKLNPDRLRVVKTVLPELGNHDKAIIGIEAEYEMKLPVPFVRKTIMLRKTSYERAWVGK